ncbi:hypothetical protein SNE26_20345 [Mucilaginibacter sp. cycad4]|uniref:hypothetical protein n=1 Tax=Mucilaginibacter sp. cycad4 TaxID=3342096 RepID=UPI002AAB7227|nr:hypothetical protein [Mucilaginibacter gossypii]WPU98379.1 hypothetical protein SNE26_20345 [Mucilaginibacter gossypii]
MNELNKLRRSFVKLAHAGGPLSFYDAVVLAVDDETFTCDVLLDEAEVYGVRLRAVLSDSKSIDVLPVRGALVVIGKLADDDYIVIACDQIAMYRITTGSTMLRVDPGGVLVSKDGETLGKILNDLVRGVLSIAAPKDVPAIAGLIERINNFLL